MQIFKIEFAFKIVKIYGDKMKNSSKILLGFMLVMMICCVSAVSATDINSTDDAIITDEIVVDDVSEIVEDVGIDDASDDVVDEEINDVSDDVVGENLRGPDTGKVNNVAYTNYFNPTTGVLTNTAATTLTFTGNFNQKAFPNFIINRAVTINANGATFNDVGFNLIGDSITLNRGTFYSTQNVAGTATINVEGNNVKIDDVNINVNVPADADFFAIDVTGANGTQILNSEIVYNCPYVNGDNTNYVIRAKNSPDIVIFGNVIYAGLPLKTVDYWSGTRFGMDMDLVAGIGLENCNRFNITLNDLNIIISNYSDSFPTLDSIIVLDSENGTIAHNWIDEIDDVTPIGGASYLYTIDVYRCDNLLIDDNDLNLTSYGGTVIPGTINGTGAAYGIQLTGGYTNVTLSNNDIHTRNNGPNCGIYSQNFAGATDLKIIDNTIYVEGNALTSHSWSLVTGIELQDNAAYIAGNTITVYNKATFNPGDNVYGISFSQYGTVSPKMEITNNNVNVINGEFAIYIQYSQDSEAYENCLNTSYHHGDDAVYDNGDIDIHDNYW